MLNDLTDLTAAFLKFMDVPNSERDPEEIEKLTRLYHVYNAAQREARYYGFVGVGCITFAERALQAAQLPDDPRAHFVAGV